MNKLSLAGVLSATLLGSPAFAAETYVLEADHTYAYFTVRHLDRGELTGVFKDVSGDIVVAGDDVKSVEVKIAVDSVDTFSAARDAHLKSPDYFNVKRYPEMRFTSVSVEKRGPGAYAITGDLTIHGQTKRVVAQATRGATGADPFGGQRTGGNVRLTIDRRDFGMTHMPAEVVGDEIAIDLYWEALEASTVQTYFANLKKALGG